LFKNNIFRKEECPFPTDEIVPKQFICEAKLNSYGGLDKIKARPCIRGDIQEKLKISIWLPTASIRLLKILLVYTITHDATIYQLNFIQVYIQIKTEQRMFVILDKEYKVFCPKIVAHFGRPLRVIRMFNGRVMPLYISK